MQLLHYPFSAVVEQTPMKTALILNAVDPSIGGVLIRGQKGTGKSTAARALARLLPALEVVEGCPFNSDPRAPFEWRDFEGAGGSGHDTTSPVRRSTPFVELPLNATEDRLAGSLHIERALQTGKRSFEPGLLAAANRGILYVDEVNLLEDHLVDMLLDAAASGINVVEREGISFVHPARFILIGTMNPEEGELRPQFLDRFGLCVAVDSVADLESREAIVRRQFAFERDPEGFLEEWKNADRVLRAQVSTARAALDGVAIPDELVRSTVRLTRGLKLQGHRADITILKAARAHAALMDKKQIDGSDVAQGARLALLHRLKPSPLESVDSIREKIERALQGEFIDCEAAPANADPAQEEDLEEMAESIQVPGSMAAGSILFSFLGRKQKETVFSPDTAISAAEIDVDDLLGKGRQPRRSPEAKVPGRTGRYVRAQEVAAGERGYRIALDATLRQAALRRAGGGTPAGEFEGIRPQDLRKKQFEQPAENLIVFVVDASESMGSGARVRMRAAKGAALAILRKAYQNRSEVALVAFGGEKADIVLSPTSSVEVARPALERLPAGGATPFADGLRQAWQVVRSQWIKSPSVRPVLVIISDGEANVSMTPGADPFEELGALAAKIARDHIAAIFIDAAAEHPGRSDMRRIAELMGASYVSIRDLTTRCILDAMYGNTPKPATGDS